MQSDENGRKVDTRYGVNIDTTNGCLIEHPLAGEITLAYAVDGRLDNTTDRVRALLLLNPGIAAHVLDELTAMLFRAEPDLAIHVIDKLHRALIPVPAAEDGDGEMVTVHDRDVMASEAGPPDGELTAA